MNNEGIKKIGSGRRGGRLSRLGLTGLGSLLATLAALALLPAIASADPAICDEYPDLPVCNEEAGGGGGGDDDPVGSEGSAGTASLVDVDAGGTGSGGELPFTGYPLTPLLLLLLLLLAIALAIRTAVAVHDRLRERNAAALPPPA